MSEQAIDLKGSLFTLSVLHLSPEDLLGLNDKLKAKISQAPGFFFRAPIVVNIDRLNDTEIDFALLIDAIKQNDLVPVGISGGSAEQKSAAKALGLAVLSAGKETIQNTVEKTDKVVEKVVEVEKVIEKTVQVEKAVFVPTMEVKRNIRSGQQIYAKDTDLIVLGSVSDGAEVIADGNIHVYGTLRGRAIAGAKGNKDAKIYCRNLKAELVSIGGNYMMSEALQQQLWDKPANIALSEEKIVVNELN